MIESKYPRMNEEENDDVMDATEKNSVYEPSQFIDSPFDNNTTILLSQKRRASFASSINQSFKKKRIL